MTSTVCLIGGYKVQQGPFTALHSTHRGLDDWLADDALVQLRVQDSGGPQLQPGCGLNFHRLGRVVSTVAVCVLGLGLFGGGGDGGGSRGCGGAERQEEGLLHPPDPDRSLTRFPLRRTKKEFDVRVR